MNMVEQDWPALPLEQWEATYRTLHMWTQIVGQNPPGPHPAAKPLVEYRPLCEYTRFDDFTDPVPWRRV